MYRGYEQFKQSGITPEDAYQALVSLYCYTNGKISEQFNNQIVQINPKSLVSENIEGLLGSCNSKDFNKINTTLNENGYVRFDAKLSSEICTKLYDYALKTPSIVKGIKEKVLYDQSNPISEIYRLDINDQINNQEIQALIMDETLINVARNYLGCEPIFDFPAMWWSTSINKEASSEAAQLYHFDMDRVKWLKIFFYLVDVNIDNGPHSYIRGSHKVDTKPKSILKKGYVRIDDAELAQFYDSEDFITLTGLKGEIFAGDTKCWHKGNPLKKGHRLVLELEYTSSLFGANYPKFMVSQYSPAFENFCVNNPIYSSKIFFQK